MYTCIIPYVNKNDTIKEAEMYKEMVSDPMEIKGTFINLEV